jgi:hypothetical protein
MLADGSVRIQEGDGGEHVEEGAFEGSRVGGQRASHRGGDSREVLETAQAKRRRLSDESGERHARAYRHFVAVELGAAEHALELQDDRLQPGIGDEHVVAAAEYHHGQVLLVGEGQRVAHVVDVVRHHKELRGSADPQGGVETERFREPDRAGDSP